MSNEMMSTIEPRTLNLIRVDEDELPVWKLDPIPRVETFRFDLWVADLTGDGVERTTPRFVLMDERVFRSLVDGLNRQTNELKAPTGVEDDVMSVYTGRLGRSAKRHHG